MEFDIKRAAWLLKEFANDRIMPADHEELKRYIEQSPVLKDKYKEFSNPDYLWDRFWYREEIDVKSAWNEFKLSFLSR